MHEKLDCSSLELTIHKLSFHVLSPAQISSLSVATLDSKTLYDIDSRRPFSGGPLDLRLGVSTKSGSCSTCHQNIQNCAGHFGQVKLVLPCYHIGFLKHTLAILNCICKRCAALLIGFTRKLGHASGRLSLEAVRNECRNVRHCPRCKAPNGPVKKNTGFRIYHEIKEPKGEATLMEINPQMCLNIFSLIDQEDYELLGIKESPCNLIIQSLLAPPSCIRPSVDMQEEGFNEDDITVKLSEIINTNKLLEDSIRKGNSLPIINEDWDYLQLQVNLLINSDLPSVNMASTPIRGLVQRLKGKSGRFRCNLSGKRVDFSGRTVISPDPNLSVEEVGVPRHIAKILTVPEKVNSTNIGFLTRLVANGVEKWPGANFLISHDEKGKEFKRYLMYAKNKDLKVGDVVERHMLDGDILLFNRQPSLHRMSIMAHKARIHGHRTLRFNECVCAPYNADFDGDEMNIHLPQTYEARVEAEELMGVRHNLCTIRNGEPLISCTQDFLTGAYLLTSRSVFLTRDRFAQLCSYAAGRSFHQISVKPAIVGPVELFTGKQVFEFIIEYSIRQDLAKSNCRGVDSNSHLNSNCHGVDSNSHLNHHGVDSNSQLNLKAKNRSFKSETDVNDGYVEILNNRFIRGRLDKAVIGGENRKGSLLYQLLKVAKICAVTAMNSIASLTSRYLAERGFSIGLDDVFPSRTLLREKAEVISKVYREVDALLADAGGRSDAELENEIGILNQIREECGGICLRELGRSNTPVVMQECGSKGSKINVAQMIACVGQQIVSDKRIQNGMLDRTLPHFPIGCKSPESKGFVLNSFFSGLTSYEFFFHAVSGREGLVDTAVKTAETGYMQRRLMKALEDLSVKYDQTVRNSAEDLVQFCYGEDGVQTLRDEGDEFLEWIFAAAVSSFDSSGAEYSQLGESFDIADYVSSYFYKNILVESVYFVSESIDVVFDKLVSSRTTRNMINPKFKRDLVDFLARARTKVFYPPGGTACRYFQDRRFVHDFFRRLSLALWHRVVDPGSAVGATAGQSIGEPGTQMTLKTFHFSGVASMDVTLGVPRLKEIINASANISTPIIHAKLTTKGVEGAKAVKGRLERLLFREIVERVRHTTSAERLTVEFTVSRALMEKLRVEASMDQIAAALVAATKGCTIEARGETIVYVVKRVKENSIFHTERVKKQILNTRVGGIEGVSRVLVSCTSRERGEYELLIEGRCLGKVLSVAGVEPYGTTTNDVLEVERTLGIEAARTMIMKEVEYTMGKYGIKVDHRHTMLLADTMSFRGAILGITRFGIGKMRASTLMLASFEQTADYLFNAAVRGVSECVEGVSEAIILGIPISLGTGAMKLYWKEAN